jgi:hypothetical protein
MKHTAIIAELARDTDGWIEWTGGPCPLAEGTRHQVRYRDGIVSREKYAIQGAISPTVWAHDPEMPRFDIIAYRVVGDVR